MMETLDWTCPDCGDQVSYPDKGMGRAFLEAWKSRHPNARPTDSAR